MSWTPAMAKEAFHSDEWVELKRLKTKRWIRVFIGGLVGNCHVVSRLALGRGEVLEDRNGDRVTITGPTGSGTDKWTYKTYVATVEIQ